ncbi:unnamed protein product [Sphagnum jensenii]|uniref:Uncharacterized protein n=1 Tax=Sphagnum jensenii TaxID=128206 RepID=A0ABP0V9W4_9BRYO
MASTRNAFLECVRGYYWSKVYRGLLTRHSTVTRVLLGSVDLGLETVGTPGLQDWDYIYSYVQGEDSFIEYVRHKAPALYSWFRSRSNDTPEQVQVVLESEKMVTAALACLSDHDSEETLRYQRTKEKALLILARQEQLLDQFRQEAIIMSADYSHFASLVQDDRLGDIQTVC